MVVSETIVNFPYTLTISLMRFKYDNVKQRTVKNSKEVEIPEEISIDEENKYRLEGSISHAGGSASSGHYVADVRHN